MRYGPGPWVAALVAAGYRMFAVNPMQVARYRERHTTSGAKGDATDTYMKTEGTNFKHCFRVGIL